MDARKIASELTQARIELSEARQRVPAHGATPQQLILVEDLEDRIAELERQLSEARKAVATS